MERFLTFTLLLLNAAVIHAQPAAWNENGKWGVKHGDSVIIPAIYDTVFGFDSSEQVCLACHKNKTASQSKFIKITSVDYTCNYLNIKNERLLIRNVADDTCGVFSLSKNSVDKYMSPSDTFAVSARGKKFLVTKKFRQLTRKGYKGIFVAPDPQFYVIEMENEAEAVLTGVINANEETVVPNSYTSVRFNPFDSLIIACSAGLGNAADDIFTYAGIKIASHNRHVDWATKRFVIYKIFEPSLYYIIRDTESESEIKLDADEVLLHGGNELKVRVRKEWFLYEMETNKKKPIKQI